MPTFPIALSSLAALVPQVVRPQEPDYPGGVLPPGAAERVFAFASERLANTAASLSTTLYPKNTSGYSVWTLAYASDWTAGFFPGAHWLTWEFTGDPAHRAWAEAWMVELAEERFLTTTHDLGFMFGTSFGNGYRLTETPAYREVLLDAALSLASRYSPVVGGTESWSWGPWSFPIIIDNLMNLELLFWAAQNGGPVELGAIAHQHALTTLVHHVRPDGTTYHLVDFDPATGEVLGKQSWGGYGTETTWARGQAWALYGFAIAWRETGDPALLDAAQRTADAFLTGLPADGVPFWDYQAPGIPETHRDSSAAAIAASGLLELSTLVPGARDRARYFEAAERTLASLARPVASGGYLALSAGGAPLSPGIVMHGCSSHPQSVSGKNLPDESLIYGDYYLLEALLRHRALARPHVARGPGPPPAPRR